MVEAPNTQGKEGATGRTATDRGAVVIEPEGRSAGRALHLEDGADGIARIVYDVPGQTVNAFTFGFATEFDALLTLLEVNDAWTGAILVSGKHDGWIGGADIRMLRRIERAEHAEAMARAGQQALDRLSRCTKPVVAAIHGPALGGGFEVALACHGRVLSDEPSTALGFSEVQLGLLPAMNGLERVAQRAGLEVALDLGLSGRRIGAVRARRLCLADEVVPRPVLEAAAIELAKRLCDGSRAPRHGRRGLSELPMAIARMTIEKTPMGRTWLFRRARAKVDERSGHHYPAPYRIIEVLAAFAGDGWSSAADYAARAFGELAVSNVARHLMDLSLATTAKKKETGVDSASVRPRKVNDVFVLGAGLMGSGIACAAVDAGMHVRMKDRDDASVGRGFRAITEAFEQRVARGKLTRRECRQRLGLLTAGVDDAGLEKADMVIEAVFEQVELKRRVLAELEPRMRAEAIFASNTSSIPIGRIAEVARHPERVLGMHYFSPVQRMQLLEVVRTERTEPEAVATAVDVGKRQGKTVIVVQDGPGFYTTRILASYLAEATTLLMDGMPVEGIDRALVEWGWPVGPLELVDEVGVDVAAHVMATMQGGLGPRFDPPDVLDRLLAAGRLGRKNERGFYLHRSAEERVVGGRGHHVDASVYAALGLPIPSAPPLAAEDVQTRCTLRLVNEAYGCLGERILRNAVDGDVGAVLGLGFPPFRGGPFHFGDEFGLPALVSRLRYYGELCHTPRFAPAPLLLEMAQANGRVCA